MCCSTPSWLNVFSFIFRINLKFKLSLTYLSVSNPKCNVYGVGRFACIRHRYTSVFSNNEINLKWSTEVQFLKCLFQVLHPCDLEFSRSFKSEEGLKIHVRVSTIDVRLSASFVHITFNVSNYPLIDISKTSVWCYLIKCVKTSEDGVTLLVAS